MQNISIIMIYLLEQFNVIYINDTEDTKYWYMDLIIWEDGLILST